MSPYAYLPIVLTAWSSVDAIECTRIGYVDADDGTFFMSLEDFYGLFEQLCICRPLMPTPCVPLRLAPALSHETTVLPPAYCRLHARLRPSLPLPMAYLPSRVHLSSRRHTHGDSPARTARTPRPYQ